MRVQLIVLTLKDSFISESCNEIKIELNFYFHTSLWCLKRFYEGLKGLNLIYDRNSITVYIQLFYVIETEKFVKETRDILVEYQFDS